MPETTKKKIPIPKSLTEGQLQPQSEMLAVERKKGNMYIGVPKVETMQENRIALVPSAVATLTGHDYRVVIEAGAGEKANYTDHRYSEAGGEIAYEKEKVFQANILLKVAPLTMEDIEMCHPNQIVISPLHIPILSQEFIQRILQKKITALMVVDNDNKPVGALNMHDLLRAGVM